MTSFPKIKLADFAKFVEDNSQHYNDDEELIEDKKWNLIIDTTGRASVFLQYKNACYIDVLNSAAMSKPRLLQSLSASLNFSKELIFNIENNENLLDRVVESLNAIAPNLFDRLVNKDFEVDVLGNDCLCWLDPERDPKKANDQIRSVTGFKFFILVKKKENLEKLCEMLDPVMVTLDY